MDKSSQIGLGFRKEIDQAFFSRENIRPDFVELAPENWIGLGGHWKQILHKLRDQYPIFMHGLSLSIGSYDALDVNFVKQVKAFMDEYQIDIYSEHLTFAKTSNAHLYDLMPIPFKEESIRHVSDRIQQVQDIIQRPLILENASYYTTFEPEMNEVDFINAIVEKSGCELLLDVNNVYVNAFNHKYDAKDFIKQMPTEKVKYIHMAGHKQVSESLIVDTHGEAIIEDVFDLFDYTTSKIKQVPILLERDFNFDDLSALQTEMDQLRSIANKHWTKQ